MLYKIDVGGEAPYMVPGDKAEIQGHIFNYISEVKDRNHAPQDQIGLYRLRDESIRYHTNVYMLVYPRMYTGITRASQNAQFAIISDDKTEVEPRERVNKDIFNPPIYPEDNKLKIRIKQILNKEQIDIRDLREKFHSDNHMNNMRHLISRRNVNLTYEKFLEWLYILGYDHDVPIYDKDGNLCQFEDPK